MCSTLGCPVHATHSWTRMSARTPAFRHLPSTDTQAAAVAIASGFQSTPCAYLECPTHARFLPPVHPSSCCNPTPTWKALTSGKDGFQNRCVQPATSRTPVGTCLSSARMAPSSRRRNTFQNSLLPPLPLRPRLSPPPAPRPLVLAAPPDLATASSSPPLADPRASYCSCRNAPVLLTP